LPSQTYTEASKSKKIEYPKPDGVLTFDLLTNLARSGTMHDDNQPVHLRIKKGQENDNQISFAKFDGPEGRFCPAGVYSHTEDEKGGSKLTISAPNCLHCKCCDIKMPTDYIEWNVPEGGGGPNYSKT